MTVTAKELAFVALSKFCTKQTKGVPVPAGNHKIDETIRICGTLVKGEDTEAKPPLKLSLPHILAAALGNVIANGKWSENEKEAIFEDAEAAILDYVRLIKSKSYDARFTDSNGEFAAEFSRINGMLERANDEWKKTR